MALDSQSGMAAGSAGRALRRRRGPTAQQQSAPASQQLMVNALEVIAERVVRLERTLPSLAAAVRGADVDTAAVLAGALDTAISNVAHDRTMSFSEASIASRSDAVAAEFAMHASEDMGGALYISGPSQTSNGADDSFRFDVSTPSLSAPGASPHELPEGSTSRDAWPCGPPHVGRDFSSARDSSGGGAAAAGVASNAPSVPTSPLALEQEVPASTTSKAGGGSIPARSAALTTGVGDPSAVAAALDAVVNLIDNAYSVNSQVSSSRSAA